MYLRMALTAMRPQLEKERWTQATARFEDDA
ncbi:hypothetical protein ACUXPL_000127 [Micrococcus sp. 140720015-1]